MEITSTTVLLTTILIFNCAIAFCILHFVPVEDDCYQHTSTRYFRTYFLFSAVGYLGYVVRPFISLELSVVIINAFSLASVYCIVFGLLWRFKQKIHFYNTPVLAHLILFTAAQTAISYLYPENKLIRLVLFYINVTAVLLYALSLFSRYRPGQTDNGRLLNLALIVAAISVLSIPISFLAATSLGMFLNIMLVNQNIVIFFMFGAILCTLFHDALLESRNSASIDPTSGVYNRRYFIEQANKFLSAAERHHFPISIIVCDIENFIPIKKQCGQLASDELIRKIAHVLKREMRQEDFISRFASEVFILLLPQTRENGAVLIAERIEAEISKLATDFIDYPEGIIARAGVSSITEYADIQSSIIDVQKKMRESITSH